MDTQDLVWEFIEDAPPVPTEETPTFTQLQFTPEQLAAEAALREVLNAEAQGTAVSAAQLQTALAIVIHSLFIKNALVLK